MQLFSSGWIVGARALGLAVLITGLMSACGLFSSEKEDKTAGWSADKLYSEAKDEMDQSGWANAVKYLETLQTRYPFGRYAQQALIEVCYAQWKDGEPDQALSSCDRFLKQYPNHPNVDYVYYLKGLISFNDNLGLFGSISGQDLSERDPKALRDAFDAFREVATRFPDSKYTPDSIVRMKYLVNALASHEVHVAAYYLRRGALMAAAERARGVIKNYQQSPETEDALDILVQAYDQLNLPDLRDDTKRVLAENFPNHEANKIKIQAKTKPWYQIW